MDLLSLLPVFIRVAQTGSFTRTADSLGLSRPVVTRSIQRLEKELGVRLFYRSTRSVTLTAEGRELLDQAEDLMLRTRRLVESLHRSPGEPLKGRIRISSSGIIAWAFLQQIVTDFLAENPGVSIELITADRDMNIPGEGIDLAFKVGDRLKADVIARRIGVVRNILCASPSYFRGRPVPGERDDLRDHVALVNLYLGERFRLTNSKGETRIIEMKGRYLSSNSLLIFNACLHGAGIAMLPYEFALPYMARGELLQVLPDWEADKYGFYALYYDTSLSRPARRFLEKVTGVLQTVGGRVYDIRVRAKDRLVGSGKIE
ncbi:MAG: LysR family transcriptional regulator [Mesosutterella sp.]|uniref:LysR family transcriptional regulator n=1 Tax=Mesosutterella faecium TaxID=2925194 RepID=A0ABT7IRB9_9BURK|nr:LysR family transcriptional regulator [Mesosutterella sp. AGMB02718]MCI6529913.1 LysR family transcriptional regulator [Mesosutterella sp.]MDL2060451.1 LysR family transcriptional regulator [Mesosutterella sp. AGMB02718]